VFCIEDKKEKHDENDEIESMMVICLQGCDMQKNVYPKCVIWFHDGDDNFLRKQGKTSPISKNSFLSKYFDQKWTLDIKKVIF
jgi:hypothetical protein